MADEVEVEIFGQTFRVAAGDAAPAYIQRLAYYVDEKMRAIASTTKTMAIVDHTANIVSKILTQQ